MKITLLMLALAVLILLVPSFPDQKLIAAIPAGYAFIGMIYYLIFKDEII